MSLIDEGFIDSFETVSYEVEVYPIDLDTENEDSELFIMRASADDKATAKAILGCYIEAGLTGRIIRIKKKIKVLETAAESD